MRIPDATTQEIVLEADKTSSEELTKLAERAKKINEPLSELVLKKGIISEKELATKYADTIGIPFISLEGKKIPKNILSRLPERIAKKYHAVVIDDSDNTIKVAMDDPEDLQAVDFLQKQFGSSMETYLVTKKELLSALDQYKGSIGSELSKVVVDPAEDESEQEVKEEDLAEDSPIAQTVNLLVEYAIKAKASDIHIEPREEYVLVRYRIDGVLQEANRLPKHVMASLVSRIKILANLKIDEHRAPQDGRFKITMGEQIFALRVSTLPIMDGEKIVMRLLNESAKALTLDELGFWGQALRTIKDTVTQPHGIILVTGPTGSGKSTTLYSVLNLLNSPGVNISTIEDPVEYRINGVNQTQTNPKAGMTFASGLRALLRQDPNIIMVGEVRDKETAELAIQAALTGHLVFSTLHTNNAATAIPRLLDMGAEPFLIASTVRAVIGQRLVRRLDPATRETYSPDGGHLERIKAQFKISDGVKRAKTAVPESEKKQQQDKVGEKKLEPINDLKQSKSILDKIAEDPNLIERSSDQKKKQPSDVAVTDKAPVQTPSQSPKPVINPEGVKASAKKLVLYRPKQEALEKGKGFSGRVGVYEVLPVTDKIQELIATNATANEIQQAAVNEGMITMQQDGFVKSLQGLTAIEEIMRVTRE